jgi:hypothetical protein
MREERVLANVRELEDVIGQLESVRDAVREFRISTYEDAGGALWAGQKRHRFTREFDSAKSSHSRISEQIGQAISDCKSKQRALAFSINPFEHPLLSAQALAIAL